MKIRRPRAADGARVWHLVENSGVLDRNSAYVYLLLCSHFSDTCAIAEQDDQLLGFVTGYRLPERPQTWFVWQVGVSARARGRGLGKRLLHAVLNRHDDLNTIEATVSPSNRASRALFGSIARELHAPLRESDGFESHLFPAAHEDEPALRIGPFSARPTQDRPAGVALPRRQLI
ncbi:diaminobutyrate acetyltransferase [Acidihalobacter ferrooxydans]|uniref:L-2,4-diaminobutyric acid acetyltransferase n=1 Tax=Acidihalobacter ferrooxydans TaxID=1765967 RepID=A0A1P8UDR1_9GAMM|nr:diaminobutyrate acetyltransferase [Acidihalobacter ferrooxydans]APZ41985.1 diaminobutyrate acetyltransferase [Acidihalobacter ferrooxydans]